jgi:hypothetical protein
MTLRQLCLLSLLALAACGGDKAKDDDAAGGAAAAAKAPESPDAYRKRQQAFADSVLNANQTSSALVQRLGKGYEVGSVRLRDTVAMLASKTDCFPTARKTDPYLAGTVSFFVNISVVGSDVSRVQESTWTSKAGNIADACLNEQSKQWKFDATFGKPAAYIVQVQFR